MHPPGFNAARLLRLMKEAVSLCALDLGNSVVFTEAATGAYSVTPILAALAGARRVYATTRTTRYASAEEVAELTMALANRAGVADRIQIVSGRPADLISSADIVTNSGHVRPIDSEFISHMKREAVVPLMYESWEFRAADIDIGAARAKDIAIAGTNERNPAVDVFSYLGVMAVKLLHDAGVAVYQSRILLLCDNPFATFIERGLARAGAIVTLAPALPAVLESAFDAVVVALQPREHPVLGAHEAERLALELEGSVVAQYWGDIDRDAFARHGIPVWPPEAPHAGHMAVLPSAIGPEAIVRLQSGGLKVGELLWRARAAGASAEAAVQAAIDAGFADRLETP